MINYRDGTGAVEPSIYRSLISGLNYLTHTGLDITFSISVLSRFMHNPSKQHFGVAKRPGIKICCRNYGFWNLVPRLIRFGVIWIL